MRFLPHITVATIVEKQGKFLLVEEIQNTLKVINQPAGHLEKDESILDAAVRETLEETAWYVKLTHLIGIYLYQAPNNVTYQRICFAASPITHDPERSLDEGIINTLWLSKEQLLVEQQRLRSPMVMKCIDDYLAGENYPLSIFRD